MLPVIRQMAAGQTDTLRLWNVFDKAKRRGDLSMKPEGGGHLFADTLVDRRIAGAARRIDRTRRLSVMRSRKLTEEVRWRRIWRSFALGFFGNGDLRHLKGDIATVADDFRSNLYQLFLQARQWPGFDRG